MKKSKFWQKAKWFIFALLSLPVGAIFYSIFPPAAFLSLIAFPVFLMLGIADLFKGNKRNEKKK